MHLTLNSFNSSLSFLLKALCGGYRGVIIVYDERYRHKNIKENNWLLFKRMTCSAVLQSLVEQHLSLFLYEDAKFYAERLYYEDPRPEHLHLLAQSYFRQGKIKQAYLILQTSNLLANLYLFALCCTQLGKFNEAENALLKGL